MHAVSMGVKPHLIIKTFKRCGSAKTANGLGNVRKLVELMREVNPEIIITHPTDDHCIERSNILLKLVYIVK